MLEVKQAKEAISKLQDYVILFEANKKLKTTNIQNALAELQVEIQELVGGE